MDILVIGDQLFTRKVTDMAAVPPDEEIRSGMTEWAEWNGKYRDDIRQFIKHDDWCGDMSFKEKRSGGEKESLVSQDWIGGEQSVHWRCLLSFTRLCSQRGDQGMKGSLATRLAGSADLYKVNKRKPYHSVNFVIAHDGFTLYDLVSYNFKHNDANGEGGNDGSNDNLSWNCGCEGETTDVNIIALRSRQMKNFHLALMISQGTPMMLMGDEYGHTRYGNNNSYGHDNAINYFQWGQLEAKRSGLFRFFKEMAKFRQKHPILRHENFLDKKDVTWHEDRWDNHESNFLAFTLHDKNLGEDIYVAFNAHDYFVEATLPSAPARKHWHRVVDTNLESPHDFVPEGVKGIGKRYNVAPYSSILLKAKH
ncbi:hypothetical protein QJS04_geneDACA024858 [Acorus gramineus]|uniref:Isoamylase 1-3-like C-terminal domain-containing protein n=1 Tax=Acorus gramineus TaxID=55184 RepID=A0AAV9A1S0_ACOGR|nr:hypothetical protein QJS04_geneDACA024858 [Acorus gramineus]